MLQRIATCCELKIEIVRMPSRNTVARTWPTDYIMQHPQMLHEKFGHFQVLASNTQHGNMSQHVATWWPNAHNMLHPTMLRYVALKCCNRLAGALHDFSDAPLALSVFPRALRYPTFFGLVSTRLFQMSSD